MSSSDKPGVLHVFDGIEEINNPLPKWWSYMFLFFIVTGAALGDDEVFTHYGALTVRSLLLAALGIVATAAVLYSAWKVLRRGRRGAHRAVHGLALVTICSQSALMLCLVWLGMIPMITWQ